MVQGVGSPYDQNGFAVRGSNASLQNVSNPDTNLPEYSRKDLVVIEFDLTNARLAEETKISGTVIWVGRTAQDTDQLEIAFDKASNDDVPFNRGSYLSGVPFNSIFVSNLAQASGIITLVIGTDRPGDRIDASASF